MLAKDRVQHVNLAYLYNKDPCGIRTKRACANQYVNNHGDYQTRLEETKTRRHVHHKKRMKESDMNTTAFANKLYTREPQERGSITCHFTGGNGNFRKSKRGVH
jgi:hypothetical protein